MTTKPKFLCLTSSPHRDEALLAQLGETAETVVVQDRFEAVRELSRQPFAGLIASATDASTLAAELVCEQVMEGMPDGVAVLDELNGLVWANERLRTWIGPNNTPGFNFYKALNETERLGPDMCPLHTVHATGRESSTILRTGDGHYFQIHAAPLKDQLSSHCRVIVTIRDATADILLQQKMEAIHKAGVELANLTPAAVFEMPVQERIDLLKSNIVLHTKDLFNFDVIEIRLLDRNTGLLQPLLAVGMTPEAEARPLRAEEKGNGVTGYVAATKKSYVCDDAQQDPHFLEGSMGAKSSLTVPLMFNDELVGTFNVESPALRAFSETDRQCLEIFSRDVALALNTLELLVAQKANTAQESVEAIHRAVAIPVDEILNDAVNVMAQFIGHDPDVAVRLQRILRNAREVKQVIQKVGQEMTPAQAVPAAVKQRERPKLYGKRILVADADNSVRQAAHNLLERYGCIVETAHTGAEAMHMVKNIDPDTQYDVVIADARLPEIDGYELFRKLQELGEDAVPMIIMTGYGYDPGHRIVKCRQAGLPANALLFKPFRLDQLLTSVEATVDSRVKATTA